MSLYWGGCPEEMPSLRVSPAHTSLPALPGWGAPPQGLCWWIQFPRSWGMAHVDAGEWVAWWEGSVVLGVSFCMQCFCPSFVNGLTCQDSASVSDFHSPTKTDENLLYNVLERTFGVVQNSGQKETPWACLPSHRKAKQIPSDLDQHLKSWCFTSFLSSGRAAAAWAGVRTLAPCTGGAGRQQRVEGSSAAPTTTPARSNQGHPGARFLFRTIINDQEKKKWFNSENLLRTSCCLEMDATKKSNTNGTMNLRHLIQLASQDAVLLLFTASSCYCTLFPPLTTSFH